ncbi:MAG: aspartyl/asparaginyl beta-hydroxylase domain-containing protein [Pseudolabrys sp.]
MRLESAVVPLFEHPVDDILSALPGPQSPLWERATFRQRVFDVHGASRSIVFNWLDNAWRPSQPFVVLRGDNLPADLTHAVADCADALERYFDGKVAKLMLAEVKPNASVAPHRDAGALVFGHRCHLPVDTNDEVSFIVDGHDFKLQAGTVYEFDNTRMHAVENRSGRRRVHLICDIMPASRLR